MDNKKKPGSTRIQAEVVAEIQRVAFRNGFMACRDRLIEKIGPIVETTAHPELKLDAVIEAVGIVVGFIAGLFKKGAK